MRSLMLLPDYYPTIVDLLRSPDWLVHNFSGIDIDIYNAVDYQYNRQEEGIEYKVIFDMNCLQYVLNIVKREESNELSKVAAAYLAFFRVADIQVDPTYAIYEKIDYTNDRAEEAISNLEQLRGLDNYPLDQLAAYALGHEQKLNVEPIAVGDREKLRNELLQYRRLTDWDSLYLCVLSATRIATDASIPRPNKILKFVEWCVSDFRFSLPALVYVAITFGRFPARKIMKYKAKDPALKRRAALRNMTWDLYYVDRYMKSWVAKDEYRETLMLTADSALKLTMQLAIKCQLSGGLEPLRPHLKHDLQAIEAAYSNRHSISRAYKSEEWSHGYRERLITEFESDLQL